MSEKHPIVAVTGSSGAGTTTVRHAFQDIFRREKICAAFVEGEAFMRYERDEANRLIQQAQAQGKTLSLFGPEMHELERLESLFKKYAEHGTGEVRDYVMEDNQAQLGLALGTFTPWQTLPSNTDLLFYEGLHGGVMAREWTRRKMSPSHNPIVIERRKAAEKNPGVDVAQHVDLLIGVVPVVSLEWIQKIHRDTNVRGQTPEAVTNTILRRLHDYTQCITPQFSFTDINFQRVPIVDTSNPFIARDVPTADESVVVIRFREPARFNFPGLMRRIKNSYMSRPNTMVIPGGKMQLALEIICTPLIHELLEKKTKKPGGVETLKVSGAPARWLRPD
ncbi:MAG: phosphoribulokinase [Gammaproteobacteria bacterium]|nr:phosphoribulokinase [Gammaproteobacteria bacterium]